MSVCPNEEQQLGPQQISVFLPSLPALSCWLGFFSKTDPVYFFQRRGGAERGNAEDLVGRRKVFKIRNYEPLTE